MKVLTKLGSVLIAIFTLCVFALLADLLYVLWRRRRFRRRSISAAGSEISGSHGLYAPSKELLYFFCWKNQSRVEPAAIPPVITDVARDSESSVPVDDEVEKWQSLCGPSRLLYTIKEEEKEGTEISSDYSADGEAKSRRNSLRDALAARDLSHEAALAATAAVADEVETPYYTPSSSPGRDEITISTASSGPGGEETGIMIGGDFLSIRIEGG